MAKKVGNQTYELDKPVYIIGKASVVGGKEGEGPFGKYFTKVLKDDTLGEKTFEKSERKMMESCISLALSRTKIKNDKVDILIGGDLLNQLVTANYSAMHFNFPFFGVYGACSTMGESLSVASLLLDGGVGEIIVCATGSHFSSAERQFRGPLELGNQRQTYSQWTVTGMGCSILSTKGKGPIISKVCIGKVIDWGVKDIANMGAAMAPAACDTLCAFFDDTKTKPEDYDMICTGDLGKLGSDILKDLMRQRGFELLQNYFDCGHMIFGVDQKAFQGGSGAGCSAVILNSYIYDKIVDGTFKKVLFLPTGALMSTTTNQQGDSIPGICHLVMLESIKGGKK